MVKLRSGILGLTLTSALALGAFSANAADIYRRGDGGGFKDEPVYAPVNSWTGFYAGVNGGGGWATGDSDNDVLSPSGGFGGGQIGYNIQGGFGLGPHLVLGVEADIQGSGITDSAFGLESNLNWFGTVRGRVGYAMDRALIYFTGGFAFGEVENKVLGVSFSDTQTGYVLGGGVEYKINPAWSLKGEYQFISLDASDSSAGGLGFSADRSEVNTVRVGLNYHFGRGYEPLK